MLLFSALGALLLAFVHFFTNKLAFSSIPRSKWLSAAGGVSVSYVFIHLLPELKEWQETFEESYHLTFDFLTNHLYFVALLGLSVFYGLERAAKLSHGSEKESGEGKSIENGRVFWVHIGSFAVYNALIGYLLTQSEEKSPLRLAMFILAMVFHFMVNDFGLLDHYRKKYMHRGRWIVSGSILAGWALGAFTEVSDILIATLFAFVAGSIVLNVLKEELPEERKSNFWAFLAGIVFYSALLMAL